MMTDSRPEPHGLVALTSSRGARRRASELSDIESAGREDVKMRPTTTHPKGLLLS